MEPVELGSGPSRPTFPRTTRVVESGTPGWQITEYVDAEGQPPRYAVVHDERRRAWGLRSEAAATRWLARLTVPVQVAFALQHPTQYPAQQSAQRSAA